MGRNGYGIPIAIVVAGLLIAGSLFLTGGSRGDGQLSTNTGHSGGGTTNAPFRTPDETDHVRGNLNAKVTLVEFSDFECPFCARLHPTLTRIVEEDEDVAWVYRHFPLSTIHRSALSSAIASECVARLGTNDDFWSFTDVAFANQRNLNDRWFEETAVSLGIDAEAFATCRADRTVLADIQADADEAISAGGRGTPFVVVVTANGQLAPFSGALPYEQIKSVVEQAKVN